MNLDHIDWNGAHSSIHEKGFSILKSVLDKEECNGIIYMYGEEKYFRKTILMERYRFGLGEYKYLQYPLPSIIERKGTIVGVSSIAGYRGLPGRSAFPSRPRSSSFNSTDSRACG